MANALSRIEENQDLNDAISNPYLDFTRVKEEIQGNPTLAQLVEIQKKDLVAKPGNTLWEGLLFYKGH